MMVSSLNMYLTFLASACALKRKPTAATVPGKFFEIAIGMPMVRDAGAAEGRQRPKPDIRRKLRFAPNNTKVLEIISLNDVGCRFGKQRFIGEQPAQNSVARRGTEVHCPQAF
jgi:hypothetical protein